MTIAPEMEPVILKDHDGGQMVFEPQPDITAYEVALISAVFAKLLMCSDPIPPDWRGYLAAHGLTRHFVEERYAGAPDSGVAGGAGDGAGGLEAYRAASDWVDDQGDRVPPAT